MREGSTVFILSIPSFVLEFLDSGSTGLELLLKMIGTAIILIDFPDQECNFTIEHLIHEINVSGQLFDFVTNIELHGL